MRKFHIWVCNGKRVFRLKHLTPHPLRPLKNTLEGAVTQKRADAIVNWEMAQRINRNNVYAVLGIEAQYGLKYATAALRLMREGE